MWREGKPKRQSEKCEVSGILQNPSWLLSHKLPAPPRRNCNFCLFVAKKGKALFLPIADAHNMVTGNELARGHGDETMPRTDDGSAFRIEGHNVGLSVRIVAKLCRVMKFQVPVGYEDEAGFHYGADIAGEFFSI
jgi:hypothetical protein